MSVRIFKAGDHVEHKLGGPVMEIMHYETEHRPLVGAFRSDEIVKCAWYENGERKTATFNQRTLLKSNKQKGLFKT